MTYHDWKRVHITGQACKATLHSARYFAFPINKNYKFKYEIFSKFDVCSPICFDMEGAERKTSFYKSCDIVAFACVKNY